MDSRESKLDFAPGFVSASDGTGRTLRFSRAERAILVTLAARPGMIFSRQRLLDAIAGEGSDSTDRSIDFLINRLRRKLGDAARAPRYIATQYGEGYWWVPQDRLPDSPTAGAFVVVGPIRAIAPARQADGRILLFAESLRQALGRRMAEGRLVVLDPDCPHAAVFTGPKPSYAVELDVLDPDGHLGCALSTRDFASGKVLHVSRWELDPLPHSEAIDALAADIVAALWRATTHGDDGPPVPQSEPLPIRMQQAGVQLAGSHNGVEVEQRLRAMLALNPDDPQIRLMLATAIHSRFIMGGAAQFLTDPDGPPAACDELEQLIMRATPQGLDDPLHTLSMAKLLYFLDRGHDRVAVSMAEAELVRSTAVVAALAVVGQIRQYEGDIEGGAELLDRAVTMTAKSSVLATYLHAIRLNGALATGERKRIEAVYAELLDTDANAAPHFELHLAGYRLEAMPAALRARVEGHDRAAAAALVRYGHFVQGRLFKRESHRANYMRGVLLAFCRTLGTDFVPAHIKRDVPSLFVPDGSLRH